MIKAAAYQWSIIQRRKVARLSSDNKSFLSVAKGPLGSTWKRITRTLHRFNFLNKIISYLSTFLEDIAISIVIVARCSWLREHVGYIVGWRVPIERRPTRNIDHRYIYFYRDKKKKIYMHKTVYITYRQGWFSPGSRQQSSQAFVGGSFGPGMHWQDSNPYARHILPVHSLNKKQKKRYTHRKKKTSRHPLAYSPP